MVPLAFPTLQSGSMPFTASGALRDPQPAGGSSFSARAPGAPRGTGEQQPREGGTRPAASDPVQHPPSPALQLMPKTQWLAPLKDLSMNDESVSLFPPGMQTVNSLHLPSTWRKQKKLQRESKDRELNLI